MYRGLDLIMVSFTCCDAVWLTKTTKSAVYYTRTSKEDHFIKILLELYFVFSERNYDCLLRSRGEPCQRRRPSLLCTGHRLPVSSLPSPFSLVPEYLHSRIGKDESLGGNYCNYWIWIELIPYSCIFLSE